jgi:hypothetical protein
MRLVGSHFLWPLKAAGAPSSAEEGLVVRLPLLNAIGERTMRYANAALLEDKIS